MVNRKTVTTEEYTYGPNGRLDKKVVTIEQDLPYAGTDIYNRTTSTTGTNFHLGGSFSTNGIIYTYDPTTDSWKTKP